MVLDPSPPPLHMFVRSQGSVYGIPIKYKYVIPRGLVLTSHFPPHFQLQIAGEMQYKENGAKTPKFTYVIPCILRGWSVYRISPRIFSWKCREMYTHTYTATQSSWISKYRGMRYHENGAKAPLSPAFSAENAGECDIQTSPLKYEVSHKWILELWPISSILHFPRICSWKYDITKMVPKLPNSVKNARAFHLPTPVFWGGTCPLITYPAFVCVCVCVCVRACVSLFVRVCVCKRESGLYITQPTFLCVHHTYSLYVSLCTNTLHVYICSYVHKCEHKESPQNTRMWYLVFVGSGPCIAFSPAFSSENAGKMQYKENGAKTPKFTCVIPRVCREWSLHRIFPRIFIWECGENAI